MAFEQLTAANSVAKKRLIANVQGHDKSGKTFFSLFGCPKPAFYICWDPNGEEVAKRLVREHGLDIRIARFAVPEGGDSKDFHTKQWDGFLRTVDDAYRVNKGTLVVDSFTEVYDAGRLAHFGKLAGVQQRNYGVIYADLNKIINAGYESEMCVVITHKLAKEYVRQGASAEGVWNGNYIPDGWKNAPYAVQANFECMYDPALPGSVADKMRVYVKNNNQAMWMQGWALPESMGGQPFTQAWFTFEAMLDWTFSGVEP